MVSNSSPNISVQSSSDGSTIDLVKPAMRRRLQQCFDHGSKLTAEETYDFDYAHTMFVQCVVHDPGNLIYIEAFLTNLERQYESKKKRLKGRSSSGKGGFKKALAKQEWSEIFKQGPVLLKNNPWDVPVLRAMAQACEAQGYNEAELRYLKTALDANPKDAAVNKHCALSLARMGQYDQSIACWHRIEEIRPNDPEPEKMISDLTISKAMGHAGKPREKNQKANIPAQEDSADKKAEEETAQKAHREIELTPRQVLEGEIVEDPTEIKNYWDLADLLVEQSHLADAESVLKKALAAAGADFDTQHRLEEVQIQRGREKLAIAEKRAKAEKTDTAVELVKQLRSDANRYELDIFYSRSQRDPADLNLKYELGLRLKRANNFAEAIKLFKSIREEPSVGAKAALELGECLQYLKQFKKALKAYDRSVDSAEDQPETLKLALYRAGVLATGLRKLDLATELMTRLVKLDPEYKDISDRLDKIKRIRHKE